MTEIALLLKKIHYIWLLCDLFYVHYDLLCILWHSFALKDHCALFCWVKCAVKFESLIILKEKFYIILLKWKSILCICPILYHFITAHDCDTVVLTAALKDYHDICCWGMTHHLRELLTMTPLSMEKLSVGRPAMFHARILMGSPSVLLREKSSEDGMSWVWGRREPNNLTTLYTVGCKIQITDNALHGYSNKWMFHKILISPLLYPFHQRQ